MDAPLPDPSPEQFEAIAGNARLMSEMFEKLTGQPMPVGRQGVEFMDGFITRQHGRDDAPKERLADMAGCYLGEALIAELGGRWVQTPDFGLGVELAPKMTAFPFAKASKHFANGPEDSVLSFFDVIRAVALEERRKHGGAGGRPA